MQFWIPTLTPDLRASGGLFPKIVLHKGLLSAEGLQRLSQLVTEFPQIQEMDINPYMVGPEGTTPIAVDARISVKQL